MRPRRCPALRAGRVAGGIGFYIQLYIRSFQYDKVATLTLVVLLIVVLVEQISVAVRRRLR